MSMQQTAYEVLKEWIITLRLPPGTPLREDVLAEKIGVSKTPLRAALVELIRDELVESEPYKGSRVALLGPQSLRPIFQMREALEGYAIATFARESTPEQREELIDIDRRRAVAAERGDLEAAAALDARFHTYPVDVLDNSYMSKVINNVADHRRRLRHVLDASVHPIDANDHGRLLTALADGDARAAQDAVIDGIRQLFRWVESADEQGVFQALVATETRNRRGRHHRGKRR